MSYHLGKWAASKISGTPTSWSTNQNREYLACKRPCCKRPPSQGSSPTLRCATRAQGSPHSPASSSRTFGLSWRTTAHRRSRTSPSLAAPFSTWSKTSFRAFSTSNLPVPVFWNSEAYTSTFWKCKRTTNSWWHSILRLEIQRWWSTVGMPMDSPLEMSFRNADHTGGITFRPRKHKCKRHKRVP